jgi:CubicO group peptidase (beta-lactamase class C family)
MGHNLPATASPANRTISRRRLITETLAAGTAVGIGAAVGRGAPRPVSAASTVPVATATMRTYVQTASLDHMLINFMTANQIPGAAVAVLQGGNLAYQQGYGFANLQRGIKVTPQTRFRMISCSKPITAASVLALHDAGKLNLNAQVFGSQGILKQFTPAYGADVDPRLYKIQVIHLLQHTAGWRSDIDPLLMSDTIATAMGAPAPADPVTIIRYMMGQPLQDNPGAVYNYSNFGYCVLGRIIETVSGGRQNYANVVSAQVLVPLGVPGIIQGHTRLVQAAPDEAHYYIGGDYDGPPVQQSVFPGGGMVEAPYGSFCLESMDAPCGWIASALDLARFATAVAGRSGRAFLRPSSLELLAGTPTFSFTPAVDWWKTGNCPGSASEVAVFRQSDNIQYAVLFNSDPDADWVHFPQGNWVDMMSEAVFSVKSWPLKQPMF